MPEKTLWSYRESFDELNYEQHLPPRWTLMSLFPTGFHPAWGPSPGKGGPGLGYYGTLPRGDGRTQAIALFEGAPLKPPFSISVEVRGVQGAVPGLLLAYRSVVDFEAVERTPLGFRVWGRRGGEALPDRRWDLPADQEGWHLLRVDRGRGWLRVRWDQGRARLFRMVGEGEGLVGLMARGGALSFENLRIVQAQVPAAPLK
ncbi:MAG TPA: hypothetical protein ENK02_13525 [Planctomycetes bacterium]|nr:hypothetical protein [Planctomycetota bacterium]